MIMQIFTSECSCNQTFKGLCKAIIFVCWMQVPLLNSSLTAQIQSEDSIYGNESEIAQLEEYFLERYGPDQKLYSGARYYNVHLKSSGHKFLGEDLYQQGKLVIDNRLYDSVQLKYDVFTQQVLLLFEKPGYGTDEIIVNNLRLEEFHLGEKVFKKRFFPETDTLFFQVFEEKYLTILYHFQKEIIMRTTYRNALEFTQSKRRSYVSIPSGLYNFNSTRSFIKLFPEHRSELKAYKREHKIQIRWASDNQIRELIEYCNQIMNQSVETP